MSNKNYPSPVRVKFLKDYEAIPKGLEHTFSAATAADYMRKGVAWPVNKEEEAKLPQTIEQIKEREEEAKQPKKKR